MRLLRDDIAAFARRYNLRQGVEAAAVISAAKKVVQKVLPEVLQNHVKVSAFKNQTLYITAPSGSAVSTVYQYRQILLQELKKHMGRANVAKIIVRPSTYSSNDYPSSS